jgi:hypothetical protein
MGDDHPMSRPAALYHWQLHYLVYRRGPVVPVEQYRDERRRHPPLIHPRSRKAHRALEKRIRLARRKATR